MAAEYDLTVGLLIDLTGIYSTVYVPWIHDVTTDILVNL